MQNISLFHNLCVWISSFCIYAEGGFEQQPANNWRGVFNISSYTQYFNVDTDIVLNRVLGSLYPIGGDFFSKIDANPDLLVPFLFHSFLSVISVDWNILTI